MHERPEMMMRIALDRAEQLQREADARRRLRGAAGPASPRSWRGYAAALLRRVADALQPAPPARRNAERWHAEIARSGPWAAAPGRSDAQRHAPHGADAALTARGRPPC